MFDVAADASDSIVPIGRPQPGQELLGNGWAAMSSHRGCNPADPHIP